MKFFISTQKNMKKGFTLIEMLVASTIFVIVITMGINAVVSIDTSFKVTQAQKQAFDILNAVMEDMERNMRLGRNFRADIQGQYDITRIETPRSCPMDPANTGGTSFEDRPCSLFVSFEGVNGLEGNPSDQITYAIGDVEGDGIWSLYKTTGPNPLVDDTTKITPDVINFDSSKSGFDVVFTDYGVQDLIFIKLSGTIVVKNQTIPFYLQTAVSPRADTFDTTETQNPTP
jgi:prepilin-type N-terminal cleavage/methylation domain-containing protein